MKVGDVLKLRETPNMVDKTDAHIIPVVNVGSGEKFVTASGVHAIKDGIKSAKETAPRAKKPDFLRMRVRHSPKYESVKDIVKQHRLATVCEEAKCPNISECWSAGTATIMLMGDVCTRACRFCSVNTGNPKGWLDAEEPVNTAKAVALMGLSYVVLTSVNRDDLPDGGAGHYAQNSDGGKATESADGCRGLNAPIFWGSSRRLMCYWRLVSMFLPKI